jgi:general nucleoside transport system permease protein
MKLVQLRRSLTAPALAATVALIVAVLAVLVAGHSPSGALSAMWGNLNGTDEIVTVVNYASRYYVMGAAVAIGFKMNLFNIGANGQYQVAALFAGAVGGALRLPGPVNILIMLIVAMFAGGAWAFIPGALNVTRNVHVVVATIMMNGIAAGLIGYLLRTKFRDDADFNTAHTLPLPPQSRMPHLNRLLRALGFHLPAQTFLHGFLFIAIVVGVLFYVLIYRTRFGYDLRSSGLNAAAARSSGVNPKRMVLTTMTISGAFAGLAAMSILLSEQYEYGDRFPTLLGFTGIGVALLGRNSPSGIAFSAVVLAAIEQGARGLSNAGIPQEIGQILQGALLVSAVIAYEVTRRRNQAITIREAAERTASMQTKTHLVAS